VIAHLCRTFGELDVNKIGRTLTRGQVYLLLHGDNLLSKRMMPSAAGEPTRADEPDTSKMTKEEYRKYIQAQMHGVKWN